MESMADKERAKAERVWEKAAPTYDRQMEWFERTQLEDGREWVASRAHGRVLEVAVGTGLNLPSYPDDAVITGVDVSPAMLDQARARARRLGRDVDLVVGDAQALPFDDASFDTVVCALGLCSFADPKGAIAEMKRVLRPGGHLILIDHVGSTWPPIYVLQWLVERITILTANEHFTRRQLPLVVAAGFELVESERRRAGIIERLVARKR
jgi:ubiquinone/menaquinone biosynthesis C-methylase UbiE